MGGTGIDDLSDHPLALLPGSRQTLRPRKDPDKQLGTVFGILIGAAWVGEILLGNLGGTTVLGNLREHYAQIDHLAASFAVGAVALTATGTFLAASEAGWAVSGIRVGIRSGIVSGAIVFVTLMCVVWLFHDAMMLDTANVREFARRAHRMPTTAELSSFLYWDAFAGAVNHLWIGPLLGVTVGGASAVVGKLAYVDKGPRAEG